MTPNSEQIIETILHLPAFEQKRVLDWLEEHRPAIDEKISEEELEAEVDRRLSERGILKEVPAGITDDDEDDFEPIEIEGEPLSETIIRERR